MSEEATFLAAIRATPMDDTLRLVYADWLDEQGRPEGAFLRLDCELVFSLTKPAMNSESMTQQCHSQ
jgi:uncharacterized protein (TIGR02996 family)